jgi:hypothetical protein
MVQRVVKMIGAAYSTGGDVHVQATYNGVEVFNGTVETVVTDTVPVHPVVDDTPIGGWGGKELFIFETTTDITGEIPVNITVNGGTLFFGNFWMNYTGFVQVQGESSYSYNSAYPDQVIMVTIVEPDSYYADPNVNTVESDGVSNLTKNAEPWAYKTDMGTQLGNWVYPIRDGETVTFDFFVDPAKVILEVPIN